MLDSILRVILAFTVILPVMTTMSQANAESCGADGICRNYQEDFGSVLVGTVEVQKDAFWGSTTDANALSTDDTFAFSGVEAYYGQLKNPPSNQWVVELISWIHLKYPNPSQVKKIGILFAPRYGGTFTSLLSITSTQTTKDEKSSLRGVAVADTNNLIGLDVKMYRRDSPTVNCLTSGAKDISPNCTLLNPISHGYSINTNDNLSFIVTPQVNQDDPKLNGAKADYAKLYIQAVEKDAGASKCVTPATPVATDKIPLDANKKPIGEGLVELISQFGPANLNNACYRVNGFFIAEMNKSFEFQTTVTGMPTTRSVDYLFYAEGHQSTPTGNVTVKLSSNGTTTPSNTNFQMNVSVDGNGTISNDTYRINCPTNCQATVPSGTPLTLTATANAQQGSTFTKWDCTGTTSTTNPLIVTMDTAKSCTAIFTTPTIPVVSEQQIKDGCRADPVSCGIPVVSKEQIQQECRDKPSECKIFGGILEPAPPNNDGLKLTIPNIKFGESILSAEMSWIRDGLITQESKGIHIFKVDTVSGNPSTNDYAKGELRLIGDMPINIATSRIDTSTNVEKTEDNDCGGNKSCKLELGTKVQISAKDPIPAGSTIDFKGDCEKINNTCKVTINKPYQVVVVSSATTPTTTTYVALTINKNVDAVLMVTEVSSNKTKTCPQNAKVCIFEYPVDTNLKFPQSEKYQIPTTDASASNGFYNKYMGKNDGSVTLNSPPPP